MNTRADVAAWAAAAPLSASDVDCATTVMLKILDGKCKMAEREKHIMAWLYDALLGRPGQRFGQAEHALIAQARAGMDEALCQTVYERRVLAETTLSRPVMKTFKAMIRAQGLFAGEAGEDSDEED